MAERVQRPRSFRCLLRRCASAPFNNPISPKRGLENVFSKNRFVPLYLFIWSLLLLSSFKKNGMRKRFLLRVCQLWDLELNDNKASNRQRSLKLHMPETAFSTMTVREDGSSTALVHSSKVADWKKNSDESHVCSKPHVSVKAWQGMEILWLPSTVLHAEALTLAKEDGATLGLAANKIRSQ